MVEVASVVNLSLYISKLKQVTDDPRQQDDRRFSGGITCEKLCSVPSFILHSSRI